MYKIGLLFIVIFIIGFTEAFWESRDFVRVRIDEKGFRPKSVRVRPGTVVEFINTGNKAHWPASDLHPSHNIYPDGRSKCGTSSLDACGSLAPGEKFVFKFEKDGVWGVHDHVFPGFLMSVTVGDNRRRNVAIQPVDEFILLDGSEQEEVIGRLASNDPKQAWEFLKETFLKDGEMTANVHGLAHIIGNRAYSLMGFEGVGICDQNFAFGCIHGVTEAALLDLGIEAISRIEAGCLNNFDSRESEKFTGCFHGIGHGLASWFDFNLEKSLAECDVLLSLNRNYCYDGVFMENALEAKSEIETGRPWALCERLDERYQYNCARYQAQRFGEAASSIADSARLCSQTGNELLKETCVYGLGYQVAQDSKGSAVEAVNGCRKIEDSALQAVCLIGTVREFIFQKYQNWQGEVELVCDNLTGSEREKCYQEIEVMSFR